MSTAQAPKSAKPQKPMNFHPSSTPNKPPTLSSHLAMVELKQRILTSLSKLSDRDTCQIAIEDLEKIIQSLSPESIPMLINCLCDSSNDPKSTVKKESLRLLSFLCQCHGESAATHLTKIIAHIVKKLKDGDSAVKDACRDAIGALSGQYLKGDSGVTVVGLFVKPLFEAMGEQNKGVQSGAALCMARMVECSTDPPVAAFQKLCPRICKLLNNQNFMTKSALLPVVASLSQVGAIAPQSLESLLQSIHECLGSTDWATRKAAADALCALALHSGDLIATGAASTLAVLEGCRFDKIKPVRDSMTEALQLWKKIAGKGGDGATDDQNGATHDGDNQPAELSEKNGPKNSNPGDKKTDTSAKDSCNGLSTNSDLVSKGKCGNIPEKAVVILKKKAPALTDKELNLEFFQKLETRSSGDLPVEVVVPRRYINSSNSKNDEETEPNASDTRKKSSINQRETAGNRLGLSKMDVQPEGSVSNKGNLVAIQRQLLQLERQQAHLMNMLQDFMGGSHDSMVTLENRVRGLERVVEDMARDLSISGRRGGNFTMGFEGSSARPLGKYNGFADYSSAKYGGRNPFGERFAQSDGAAPGIRGRGPPWRSEMSDDWDFPGYGAPRNGQSTLRRAQVSNNVDVRSPTSEHETDQVGGRRGWEKGSGPVRLGEGPSARSVWQASKDEATLEAIRVAGEDGGTSRMARVPELTAEAVGDDNVGQERDSIWTSWSNAMHALRVGDMDSAYAEVVSTGDDLLLVKLMDRSGPVIDQLSNEVANEVLHAVVQLLLEQDLYDICLCWIQQLAEVVLESGADALGIPLELKKELLLNLHEASAVDPPEDWEGPAPDQLILQLASAWGIELQQFDK